LQVNVIFVCLFLTFELLLFSYISGFNFKKYFSFSFASVLINFVSVLVIINKFVMCLFIGNCCFVDVTGCGQGELCDSVNAATAHCDQCDFDHSLHQCYSYLLPPDTPTNQTECAAQGPVVVYTGTQLSFTGDSFSCALDRLTVLLWTNATELLTDKENVIFS